MRFCMYNFVLESSFWAPRRPGDSSGGPKGEIPVKNNDAFLLIQFCTGELIVSGEVAGAAAREGRKGIIPGPKKLCIFAYIILY